MKIQPLSQPGKLMPQDLGPKQEVAQAAKARAVAKITGQGAPIPVNANSISPEEVSAVKSKTSGQESGQNTILEETTEQTLEATSTDAVETTTENSVKTEAKETPAKEEQQPSSSQMAILVRKERALRAKAQQQEQAFRTREAELKAREAAIASKDQEYQSGYISKQRIKQDLLGVMAEEGLSYDELTQQLINQQPENPRVKAQLAKLEAANKALEDKLSSFERNAQDQQSQSYKAALNQIKLDVKSLVNSDPNFEAVKATNSITDVVELIEETYKKDGVLLSVEEATQEVEDYLVDEAYKLSELKKVQKRRQTASTTAQPTKSQTPVTQKQPQPMKTLTNATASTRQLSAKERAILAFRGELKS